MKPKHLSHFFSCCLVTNIILSGPAGAKVLDVALGTSHTCALLDSGVKCFGNAAKGQLGIGTLSSRGGEQLDMGENLPYVDLGRSDVPVELAAGGAHNCVRFADGAVKCWGANGFGQLGLGDRSNRGGTADDMGTQLPNVDLGQGQVAVALSLGDLHSCALLASGAVKCWGLNTSGQLGQGDSNNRGDQPGEMGDALSPIELGNNLSVAQISAGGVHSCARFTNGQAKCWGNGDNGQLGLGDALFRGLSPDQMGDALPFINLGENASVQTIRAGFVQTCVSLADRGIKCFGYNRDGRLGLGDLHSRGAASLDMGENLPILRLGNALEVKDFQCSYRHCCATMLSQTGKCWGLNNNGQLGTEDRANRGIFAVDMGDDLPYLNLSPMTAIIKIATGSEHTCAIINSGDLKCWGSNKYGQLGLGDSRNRGHERDTMDFQLPNVSL